MRKQKKGPKRQNIIKQQLRTGKTFDSDMLHFCTFEICFRIPSCFGAFLKFPSVTFGIFAILASAHFGVAENILANFVIFVA